LAEVNGGPAIAYLNPLGGELGYVDGTWEPGPLTWNPPVAVMTTNDAVMFDGLFVLPSGVPAIVFHNLQNDTVTVVNATDATGDDWELPIQLGDTGGEAGLLPRPIVIGNTAHVFYYNFATDELKHTQATTTPWNSWDVPETVASGLDGAVVPAVADFAGRPAVAYVNTAGEPRVAVHY
jgi:hypothetical protein